MARKALLSAILAGVVLACCKQGTSPGDGGNGNPPLASDERSLVSFVFEAELNAAYLSADVPAIAAADDPSTWEASGLPAATVLDDLVPSFAVSPGATLLFAGRPVSSGETRLPCSAPVELSVRAEDGSETAIHLRVSKSAPRSGKDLVSLSVSAPPLGDSTGSRVSLAATILRPILADGSRGEGGEAVLFAPALDFSRSRVIADLPPGARLETAGGLSIGAEGEVALVDGSSLRIVAEDGSSASYRVTLATEQAAAISAVLMPAATGDPSRIELAIRRKAELAGARLVLTLPGSAPRILATLSALPGWDRISDGGRLRIWPASCLESGLATPGLVDVPLPDWPGFDAPAEVPPMESFLLSIEVGGQALSVFPVAGPESGWFTPDGLASTPLPAAASLGLWSGQALQDALAIGDLPPAEGAADGMGALAGRGLALAAGKAGLGRDDYEALPGSAGICAASCSAALAGSCNRDRIAPVSITCAFRLSGGAGILGATADLSCLGMPPAGGLSRVDGTRYALELEVGPGLAEGRYEVPLAARLDLGGAIVLARRKLALEVLPPRAVSVLAADLSPTVLSTASATRHISLEARTAEASGASVERVTADLSPLGGDPASPLSRGADGGWSLATALECAPRPGLLDIAVTAWDDGDGISATGHAFAAAWEPAFAGADMEAPGPADMPARSAIDTASPFEGAGAFRYATTVSANALVAVSSARLVPPPGAARLVFWFKGSSDGSAPGLRFQLGSGGSNKCYYDLNAIGGGGTFVARPVSGGAYSTTPIAVAEWTRVELDLSGLVVSGTAGDSLSNYPLQFRVRAGGVSDWQIDFPHFE